MKKLFDKTWDYTLYEDDGKLILVSVEGTVGIYELTTELTEEQKARYEKEGEPYLEQLVRQIRKAHYESL